MVACIQWMCYVSLISYSMESVSVVVGFSIFYLTIFCCNFTCTIFSPFVFLCIWYCPYIRWILSYIHSFQFVTFMLNVIEFFFKIFTSILLIENDFVYVLVFPLLGYFLYVMISFSAILLLKMLVLLSWVLFLFAVKVVDFLSI